MKKPAQILKKSVLAVSALALGLGAAGCNTVKGLGEDIQSVGEAGEEAID